jgi:hypothetical protein
MKPLRVVVGCVLVVGVGAAVASAGEASQRAAWTESKAELLVQDEAKVSVALDSKIALVAELRRAVAVYRALAQEAFAAGDGNASSSYSHLAYNHARALARIRGGLEIESADCSGSGQPAGPRRFSRFRCRVTSESLEIPPTIAIEGTEIRLDAEPRTLGPVNAEFDVRVTGPSSFTYRKA